MATTANKRMQELTSEGHCGTPQVNTSNHKQPQAHNTTHCNYYMVICLDQMVIDTSAAHAIMASQIN